MKVLNVNAFDIQGGASRAAYRLHMALLVEGVDSQMLVQYKSSDDFTIIGPEIKIQKAFAKFGSFLDAISVSIHRNRIRAHFSPLLLGFRNTVDIINQINPDIVHLRHTWFKIT